METRKLTQDQFARFMAEIILSIENYNFDVLYDVRRIMDLFMAHRDRHESPERDSFHLMIRSTGCDMVKESDANYELYDKRSAKIYSLSFCWNYSYMSNEVFCKVIQLR